MDWTLKELKEKLRDTAGISGMTASNSKLVTLINKAVEELMDMHDWPDIVERYRFNIFDPYIVLPAHLRKVTHAILDRNPIEIKSPWFEYVQHGPGELPDNEGYRVVLQRNRTPVFRQPPEEGGPWRIRVKAFADETTYPPDAPKLDGGIVPDPYKPLMNIRGYDGDEWITSDDQNGRHIAGEELPIDFATPFGGESQRTYTFIESVNMPVTHGKLELRAFNELTNAEILLAGYLPHETTPAYRTYTIPGLLKCKKQTVLLRIRQDFVIMIHDDDIASFGKPEAIRSMMIAQYKQHVQDLAGYGEWRKAARDVQMEREKSSEQKNKAPAISHTAGHGMSEDEVPHIV